MEAFYGIFELEEAYWDQLAHFPGEKLRPRAFQRLAYGHPVAGRARAGKQLPWPLPGPLTQGSKPWRGLCYPCGSSTLDMIAGREPSTWGALHEHRLTSSQLELLPHCRLMLSKEGRDYGTFKWQRLLK